MLIIVRDDPNIAKIVVEKFNLTPKRKMFNS